MALFLALCTALPEETFCSYPSAYLLAYSPLKALTCHVIKNLLEVILPHGNKPISCVKWNELDVIVWVGALHPARSNVYQAYCHLWSVAAGARAYGQGEQCHQQPLVFLEEF